MASNTASDETPADIEHRLLPEEMRKPTHQMSPAIKISNFKVFENFQRMRLPSPLPYPSVRHSFYIMSQHPSLKGKSSISARRSVLKRFERVELLRKRGQFKDGQRVIGLPKTKPEE